MAVIDISSKLNVDEESLIKIDEKHEFKVDCGAETMLVAQEKFKNGQSIEDYFEIIKLFLGEKALKVIRNKNLTLSKLSTIIIAIMAQANEISYEEMEKRFQEQVK